MQRLYWLPTALILIVTLCFCAVQSISPSSGDRTLHTRLKSAPSLLLRVTLGGSDISIHGEVAFDIFAKPVVSADNATVRYDGFTTITQGDTRFTYKLVDGVGYVVTTIGDVATSTASKTVECISSVSPFDLVMPALNNASAKSSATLRGDPIECQSGSLLHASFGGADFTLCAFSESGATAFGTFRRPEGLGSNEQAIDIVVSIEYLSSPIKSISAPALSDKQAPCPVRVIPTAVTPTTLALMTGDVIHPARARDLKATVNAEAQSDSCTCKSTPRPCIFLHGLGNPNEEEELQDTPVLTKKKYGYIGNHAPCCTTVKYAVLNTVDYGWRNESLQNAYCDHSLSMSETSDLNTRTIKDTIVVTHSMGGLVMAGALANRRCSFSDSTSWVSMSAPMRGSMATDFSEDLCTGKMSSVVEGVLELIGKCPSSVARKSVPYQNGKYSTPEINEAYVEAQEAYRGNVYAAMCSNSYSGVLSSYLVPCIAGGIVIPHKSSQNDGLVEFESCLGGLDASLFGDSYLDRFYAPRLNHADTAFLTHDNYFRDSQKPFKWFECLL